MIKHPSTRSLRMWLDGERPDVESHVRSCERCSQELDELTRLEPALQGALFRITVPDQGFLDRLEERLESRHREAERWSVLVDLFSVPWYTIEAVMQEELEDD